MHTRPDDAIRDDYKKIQRCFFGYQTIIRYLTIGSESAIWGYFIYHEKSEFVSLYTPYRKCFPDKLATNITHPTHQPWARGRIKSLVKLSPLRLSSSFSAEEPRG